MFGRHRNRSGYPAPAADKNLNSGVVIAAAVPVGNGRFVFSPPERRPI
jgi:hypothetical protein